MCDTLNPLRYAGSGTEIPIGSQTNFSVVFPSLPKRVDVAKILVRPDWHENKYLEFEIGNLTQLGEDSSFEKED